MILERIQYLAFVKHGYMKQTANVSGNLIEKNLKRLELIEKTKRKSMAAELCYECPFLCSLKLEKILIT